MWCWCQSKWEPKNRSNRKYHPKNKHTQKSQIATVFGWSWIISITALILGSQPEKKENILVSTPRGPSRVGKHKGPGSGSTSFSASRSVGQSGRTLGFPFFVGQWWCRKKPNGDIMCGVKVREQDQGIKRCWLWIAATSQWCKLTELLQRVFFPFPVESYVLAH